MDVSRDDVYFKALYIMSESTGPVGAWKLSRMLSQKGLRVSEATAGRLLRAMEDRGHVSSEGRTGRVITPKGKEVLKEWLDSQVRNKTHTAFMESLKIRRRQELIDVLVARRAIEAETAALAALNATSRDTEELWRIVEEHQAILESGMSGIEKDLEFHRALASASKNKVLAGALDVIYHDPDIGRALEYIRAKVGSSMVEDHREILKEVARKDPEAARQAMVRHISNVINDVNRYWSEIRGSSGRDEDVGERQDPGWVRS